MTTLTLPFMLDIVKINASHWPPQGDRPLPRWLRVTGLTAAQAQFVRAFHGYLNEARVVFALSEVHDHFSLVGTVENQNRRLYSEARADQ
ncbi:hypothetical protein BBJ28_00021970 [Nothophytophthora sp. Chile5]|nr:hypothetical protein BBJ28_00021970 [Nothophytophthora sp. Chile5]